MSVLGKRYAEALLSLAIKEDKVEKTKKDLDLAKELFSSLSIKMDIGIDNDKYNLKESVVTQAEGLYSFLKNVKLSKETKIDLVKSCLGDKVDDLSLQFIYILIEKNRISYYEEIFDEYHKMANHELNIKEGIIESVRPLDDKKIKELEDLLSNDKEKVVLIPRLNDDLISGFKITFEHEVIDVSMQEKIRKMTEMLSGKESI